MILGEGAGGLSLSVIDLHGLVGLVGLRPDEECANENTPDVTNFAQKLEEVVISTVKSGHMTKDLAILIGPDQPYETSEEYLATIADHLKKALA